MESLKRIQVGEFRIEDSLTLKELEENKDNLEFISSNIISIEKLFENNKSIELDDKKLTLFLNGVRLTQRFEDGIYRIYGKNHRFIGIGTINNYLLKRDIIM